MAGPGAPGSTGVPGASNGMPAPGARAPGTISMGGPQLHHHHAHPDGSAPGQEDVSAEAEYPTTSRTPRPATHSQPAPTQSDTRQAQVFSGYPSYPNAPTTGRPSMAPLMHDGLGAMGRPGGNATMVLKVKNEKEEQESALFGDVPEGKRHQFRFPPILFSYPNAIASNLIER